MEMTFRVRLLLGNDAMQTCGDVADALRRIADVVDRGADGPLWVGDADHVRDLNGNTIGTWSVQGE